MKKKKDHPPPTRILLKKISPRPPYSRKIAVFGWIRIQSLVLDPDQSKNCPDSEHHLSFIVLEWDVESGKNCLERKFRGALFCRFYDLRFKKERQSNPTYCIYLADKKMLSFWKKYIYPNKSLNEYGFWRRRGVKTISSPPYQLRVPTGVVLNTV